MAFLLLSVQKNCSRWSQFCSLYLVFCNDSSFRCKMIYMNLDSLYLLFCIAQVKLGAHGKLRKSLKRTLIFLTTIDRHNRWKIILVQRENNVKQTKKENNKKLNQERIECVFRTPDDEFKYKRSNRLLILGSIEQVWLKKGGLWQVSCRIDIWV